ncbi:antitoxin Xre/MbcA/ParS toxin-binding domain-containing protein [Cupriavidus pinatubonensis]|uniref:antitoxin Xre/MbcA/ParS toxin-binding domain-containing protein n=1 Tax=Cupriavidus TaxID=106589 RepID=UPI00360A7FBD
MLVVSPENISAAMALSPPLLSIAELDAAVREGLPKSALREIVEHVVRTSEERRALMSRIVPEATFKRRKDRLTPDESEKTERLARIFATANFVWDDEEDARAFLNAAHPLLGGSKPLDVAMTELGARRVEELLWRLFYGMSA